MTITTVIEAVNIVVLDLLAVRLFMKGIMEQAGAVRRLQSNVPVGSMTDLGANLYGH